jgi:hypothetical protein
VEEHKSPIRNSEEGRCRRRPSAPVLTEPITALAPEQVDFVDRPSLRLEIRAGPLPRPLLGWRTKKCDKPHPPRTNDTWAFPAVRGVTKGSAILSQDRQTRSPCHSTEVRSLVGGGGRRKVEGVWLVERPCDSTQLLERPGRCGPASLRAQLGELRSLAGLHAAAATCALLTSSFVAGPLSNDLASLEPMAGAPLPASCCQRNRRSNFQGTERGSCSTTHWHWPLTSDLLT